MKKFKRLFVSGWRMQEPCSYRDEMFKPLPSWDKCMNVLGDYVEK
jgi:hypothetical protein